MLENYLKYRKLKPEYKNWKNQRDLDEAKRQQYLAKNPVDENQKAKDMARAKAVLNAVDVMDEYSQSRAEDMEMTIEGVKNTGAEIGSYLGMALGAGSLFLNKSAKKVINAVNELGFSKAQKAGKFTNKDLIKGFAPAIVLWFGAVLIPSALMSAWGAKKEVEASRYGRVEAMEGDLQSAKQFAQLTPEQEKQRDEIAKTIKISPKEAKQKPSKSSMFGFGGIFKSLGTLFRNNGDYEEKILNFNKKISADRKNFDKVQLTQEEIEEAKKDKQLIQNVVEKVDIASQDYAEDVELATDAITIASTAVGFGSFGGVSKILSKFPIADKTQKIISGAIGLGLGLAGALFATKLQKQSSRVARYKVKQDFLNHPEKLLYVDEEKYKNEQVKDSAKEEKKGFFSNLAQIIKDNKEYNQYVDKTYIEKKQKQKALDKIEITPEQEKRAKQLQQNTFRMFSTVDEKSQTYSESTEATGEVAQQLMSYLCMIPGMILSGKNMFKLTEMNDKELAKVNPVMATLKAMAPIFISIIPAIAFNAFVTKEQKGASRVADMEAIKEMDDYRNFANYDDKFVAQNKIEEAQQLNSNSNIEQKTQQNNNETKKLDVISK